MVVYVERGGEAMKRTAWLVVRWLGRRYAEQSGRPIRVFLTRADARAFAKEWSPGRRVVRIEYTFPK